MRCPGWPCDTPHAIEPAIWRKESEKYEVADLVRTVHETADSKGIKNICWTGGEPFIQKKEDLQHLFWELDALEYTQEVFSNGSVLYPPWTMHMLTMMDWKLTGSGEQDSYVHERNANAKRLDKLDGIKFVVCSEFDLDEAVDIWHELTTNHEVRAQFWVGAAWGRISSEALVNYVLRWRLPWKLNVQVHKYIWEPDERGV